MKLTTSLLLPALVGVACGASDVATVYTFPASEQHGLAGIPTLAPEDARLVIAQRLGVSQYHNLRHAASQVVTYINDFGGSHSGLFSSAIQDDDRSQLVLVVEGVNSKIMKSLMSQFDSAKPAFDIADPPSKQSNAQLIKDIMTQSSAGASHRDCSIFDSVNPWQQRCWAGKYNFVHYDAQSSDRAAEGLLQATKSILQSVEDKAMDVMMILMPESSGTSNSKLKPYGSYDMPTHSNQARSQAEELISVDATGNPLSSPSEATEKTNTAPRLSQASPKFIIPRCHASIESCNVATSNCSGHGSCKKKYGEGKGACYACACLASVNVTEGYKQSIYWGGSACQKEDISSQFWLLAGFSVAAVGLVSWGIGMLFSIGEEKLPGVIGAGVSAPKAR